MIVTRIASKNTSRIIKGSQYLRIIDSQRNIILNLTTMKPLKKRISGKIMVLVIYIIH